MSMHENESVGTVLFTAGTVLLMAILKRFLVMFFIEQWRVWIFLLLNIILLAIFITSMRSSSSEIQESNNNVEMNIQRKKWRKQCKLPAKVEGCNDCQQLHETRDCEIKQKLEHEHEQVEDNNSEPQRLSKEELNERVEAFIAMFRQHLVSDAIKVFDSLFGTD
ncbi:DUF761 domain-containing protein, partial [Cephalotus follicularis]